MSSIALQFILALFAGQVTHADQGRLSMYHPGDGHNRGLLSCGGQFTWEQNHIAYRKWYKMGCGRRVIVCAVDTGRCAMSEVRDAGPFGIYRGKLRNCKKEGRWRRWTKKEPPPQGWKFRAVADLSHGLWTRLGKPKGLSRIYLFFLRKDKKSRESGRKRVCTIDFASATL